MKVLDLQCAHEHSFEGWFASEEDYRSQLERKLVSCPLCGDSAIQKMLSAPRLNLRAGRDLDPAVAPAPSVGDTATETAPPAPAAVLQAKFLQAMREVMAHTVDVGDRFADQARGMHHGDIEQRSIRGQTTPEVAMELIEEGIEVMPLLVPPGMKETLQ